MSACPYCKHPMSPEFSREPFATCPAKGGEACELYCQLTEAKERLDAAERVIEAAERVIEQAEIYVANGHVPYMDAYAAYQAIKRPDKEE